MFGAPMMPRENELMVELGWTRVDNDLAEVRAMMRHYPVRVVVWESSLGVQTWCKRDVMPFSEMNKLKKKPVVRLWRKLRERRAG